MSYFQKHVIKGSLVHEVENIKPHPPTRQKKNYFNAKTEPNQEHHRSVKHNDPNLFDSKSNKSPLPVKSQVKEKPRPLMPERDLSGLMLQGQNSMQELLNSSINQFTKYLSDRDPLQQQHQQLVAQNKDLRNTLDKLKTIIKQKLVSALSKQRQELNAVMEDYVQLITKLLADKEELTATLEQLEHKYQESQKRSQEMESNQKQAQKKVEELSRDREQHIAKTKHQIDDFLKIIEQYEEEAEQEGQEGEQLRQKIAELEEEISKNQHGKVNIPPKTQALLQMLERAQQENKMLREQLNEGSWSQRISTIEREHEQEFMEYQRAMRETLNKKDECITRLSSIIESYRQRRGKDTPPSSAEDIYPSD